MFATATSGRQSPSDVRQRMLGKAIEAANKKLGKDGAELMPASLTPHSLRRTCASMLFAIGEGLPYAMSQLGHMGSKMTLGVYARAMNRRDGEPERLKALVEGAESAAMGSSGASGRASEAATRGV